MSRRARVRPPRLVPREIAVHRAPPATPEELLERANIAGRGAAPGPTELRRFVERIAEGNRAALGELEPMVGLMPVDVRVAVERVFGATVDAPTIDAPRTLAAASTAAARLGAVASTGARVAVATAAPASLLTVHLAFVELAREAGADVADLDDVGPLRADGRAHRFLRWTNGVAAVTDGHALCATRDGSAAREWLFVVPRPALVVADGPFAEVAWEAGIEVVALGGLDRAGLAIAAARADRCTFVPLRTDRAPRAYAPVVARVAPGNRSPHPTEL